MKFHQTTKPRHIAMFANLGVHVTLNTYMQLSSHHPIFAHGGINILGMLFLTIKQLMNNINMD